MNKSPSFIAMAVAALGLSASSGAGKPMVLRPPTYAPPIQILRPRVQNSSASPITNQRKARKSRRQAHAAGARRAFSRPSC